MIRKVNGDVSLLPHCPPERSSTMKMAQSRNRLRLVLLTVFAIIALLLPTVATAAPVTVAAEAANQHYGCATTHTVQRGDTLSQIARTYGVTMQSIMSVNNISNPNHIWVGQRLCIPGTGGPTGGCSVVHTVRPGETLSQISRWYGVSMWSIMNANGIANANHIYVGQRLCIPSGSQPPAPQPVPPIGCWEWYTVRAGDTLNRIAGWYGTTVQNLMVWNNLSTTTIWVGQTLMVPVACPNPNPPPCNCPPPPPPPCNCPTPAPTPQPSGPWFSEFFNNTGLSGSPVFTSQVENISFNWGQGSPGNGIPNDFWSARFTRQVWLDAGTYRFYATADDGVRVWVNNQLVIDGWRVQAATSYFGDIALGSGNQTIRVEFFEDTGDAVLYVNWTRLN
jgi:LysM repeat protein